MIIDMNLLKRLEININSNILVIGSTENCNQIFNFLYYHLKPNILYFLDKKSLDYSTLEKFNYPTTEFGNYFSLKRKIKDNIKIETNLLENSEIDKLFYKFNFIYCSNILHFIKKDNINNILLKIKNSLIKDGITFIRIIKTINKNIPREGYKLEDYYIHDEKVFKKYFTIIKKEIIEEKYINFSEYYLELLLKND